MRKAGLTLTAFLLLAGCGRHEVLPVQVAPDLVKITTMAGFPRLPRRDLREKEQIAALVSFVNSLPDKWGIPWYGAPVGRVYFEFITKGKIIGNFYVGPNFFGRVAGKSYSQGATRGQIEELGKIVELDLWGYLSGDKVSDQAPAAPTVTAPPAAAHPSPTAAPRAPAAAQPTRHP
jgi:hypothetical protein